MLKGFTRNFEPLNLLTESEVDAIWRGALYILEHTGLKFQNDEAIKILESGGCKVDYNNRRVNFPPGLVIECLQKCPSTFRIEARDPKNDIVFGGNKVYAQPGPGMEYIDIDTFEPRIATRKEFYDAVTVYDALPNLHYYHANSPNTSFEGVPPILATLETLAGKFRNSTKVPPLTCSFDNDIFGLEMAKVVGVKGFTGGGGVPPLAIGDEQRVNGFIRVIKAGVPISFASGGTMGASAPATIAGTIASVTAHDIGPIVLAQIIDPGHPVIPAIFDYPQNMRNGAPLFGNILGGLLNAGFHQVWRRYRIPTGGIESGICNSKCIDYQSGYEKGTVALASAISGAHFFWIHGTVYGELTAHPVQAIMDDDVSGAIGRFLEGIEISDETLALDMIDEVGPAPNFYLNQKHTRDWWRKEQFVPAVADMLTLPEWIKEGKKANIDLAKEKMEDILATHKVSTPLTASQDEDIERILEEATKYYKDKGLISEEELKTYRESKKSPNYPYA